MATETKVQTDHSSQTYREVEFLRIDGHIKRPCKLMLPESLENHLLKILQLVRHGAFAVIAVGR